MSEAERGRSLSEQAAEAFSRESADERDARRRELEGVASGFTSPVELYEGGMVLAILGLLCGILFLAFGVFGEAKNEAGRVMILVMGVAAVAGAGGVLAGRNKVVLTLTPTGILFRGSDRELPWEDVDSMEVNSKIVGAKIATILSFYLREGAETPVLSGRRRTKYLRKEDVVRVHTMGVKGFEDRPLYAMLENAHDAGVARAMLKEM